jgi:hypothetical protein
MLIDEQEKMVELYIENLLWGRITANFYRIIEKTGNHTYVDHIHEIIERWQELKRQKEYHRKHPKLYFYGESELNDITQELYKIFREARVDGTIVGELKDEKYEKKIQELELKVKEGNLEREQLKAKVVELSADNIKLVNELTDRDNMIATYEKQFYAKKE